MKHFKNDFFNSYYNNNDTALDSITRFSSFIKKFPLFLEPINNNSEQVNSLLSGHVRDNKSLPQIFDRIPIFHEDDFYLFPTVKKTTIFYDEKNDCFIKIIHSLTLKDNVLFSFNHKGCDILRLSENLLSRNIKVPKVISCGTLKNRRSSFYIMERTSGTSLFNILIKEEKRIPFELYLKTIDEVISLHTSGYWFGDLRISHVFIKNEEISGFIDIDSTRKNRPFRLKNIAKDLAGLNSPGIPLTKEEKKTLFNYYINKTDIARGEDLLKLVKHYTKRRWKNYGNKHISS